MHKKNFFYTNRKIIVICSIPFQQKHLRNYKDFPFFVQKPLAIFLRNVTCEI